MIIAKRVKYCILSLLITTCMSLAWPVEQDAQQGLNGFDPSQFLALLKDPEKLQELQQVFANLNNAHTLRVAREQREMKQHALNLLAPDEQEQIINAQSMYHELVTALSVEKYLLSLCEKVGNELDAEKDVIFKRHLDKLHAALLDRSLMELLFPGHLLVSKSQLMGHQNPTFTMTDLQLFVGASFTYQKAMGDAQQSPSLQKLIALLRLALEKKVTELCTECAEMLAPQFKATRSELQKTISMLADVIVKAAGKKIGSIEESDAIKKGAKLWLDEFKKYKTTIDSFLAVYRRSQIDMSFVVKALMRTHEICEPIFSFYRDNKDGISFIETTETDKHGKQNIVTVLNATNALDGALRWSVMASSFVNEQGKSAEQLVQDCLLRGEGLAHFTNPLDQIEYQVSKIATTSLLFLKPTAHSDRVPPLKKFLIRIILVWALSQGRQVLYESKQWGSDTHKLWEPGNGPLKAVCLDVIKTFQAIVTGKVYYAVAGSADPITLEKIENYTLGLLKPELIYELSDILFHVIFQKESSGTPYFEKMRKVIAFDKADLFKYDYFFHYGLACRKKRSGQVYDINSKDYADIIKDYATYKLVTYAGTNVGAFCGKEIAGLFGNVIERWALSAMKWVVGDQGSYEAFEARMAGDLRDLRVLVELLFESNSAERAMIVDYLKNLGLFKQQGFTDKHLTNPRAVNYAILAVVTAQLAGAGLLTHVQSATFLDTYMQKPREIGSLIEEIFVAAKNNMTRAAGGIVGRSIGWAVAQTYLWGHIPVYHDTIDAVNAIKDKFTRS